MKSIICLLSYLPLVCLVANSQIVDTQFGQIQGLKTGSVFQFLGIPFAKPPVGELRWEIPQNRDKWTGILSTTAFAPVCPQKRYEQGEEGFSIEGKEDCLYLNIWTPSLDNATRPVLVFIHGGGNQQGGASLIQAGTQIFDGYNMAYRGNAVIVTIQYRLGPLGFLCHPGLEHNDAGRLSGNYAVFDQIMALTWVKNNISKFGGDPMKIMIFGESAGGINVGNLMVSSLSTGLFQRACIESATPIVSDYNSAKAKGIEYVNSFIKEGSDAMKIANMRLLPSDSLISKLESPLEAGLVQMNWQAVMDNYTFKKTPLESFRSTEFNHVPFMIGSNSEEMSRSAPQTVYPVMVSSLIRNSVPEKYISSALQLYPPGLNTDEARISYVNLLTDAQFTATTRRISQCISQNQEEPVWRYFFTHKHTIPQLENFGSYHGMELFYVFNNWENSTLGKGILFKQPDKNVQDAMLKYWVNFANTGNPNAPGLPVWPVYQSSIDSYLEIKSEPESHEGLRIAQSNFWDNAVGFTSCTGSVGSIVMNETEEVWIFPNPVQDILNIEPSDRNEPFSIDLFDITGKLLITGKTIKKLDVSWFSSGFYYLSIKQNGKKRQFKIMKI